VSGLPSASVNWTSQTSVSPILVVYSAQDTDNQTISVTRKITVVDPCTLANALEHTCLGHSTTCSINGDCGAEAAVLGSIIRATDESGSGSFGGVKTAAAAAAAAAAAIPDKTHPVITVIGNGDVFTTIDGTASGMITKVLVGSNFVDSGATATKTPRCVLRESSGIGIPEDLALILASGTSIS